MTEQVSKTIHSVTDDIPLEGDIKKYNLALFSPDDGFKKGDKVVVFSNSEYEEIQDKIKEYELQIEKIDELGNNSEDLKVKDIEIDSLKNSLSDLEDKSIKEISIKNNEIESLKKNIIDLQLENENL